MADTPFVLGVDLDGVCADFNGRIREIAAEWLGKPIEELTPEVSYEMPEWNLNEAGGYERLHRFAVTQRQLFRSLPPFEGVAVTLRRLSLKDIRIRIITHRLFVKYFHREAVQQTIEWLDYYDIPYWDLCFMGEKTAVGADLYIEDAPQNIEKLRASGHDVIVFTNSTNRGLADPRANSWADVERLVLVAVEAWKNRKR